MTGLMRFFFFVDQVHIEMVFDLLVSFCRVDRKGNISQENPPPGYPVVSVFVGYFLY